MSTPHYILICDSKKPKIADSGCCHDRGGAQLIQGLQQCIQDLGLIDTLKVKASACLSNCPKGISAKVFPGRKQYEGLNPGDAEKYIQQVLADLKT